MMLREFKFPAIALHSMMKQVCVYDPSKLCVSEFLPLCFNIIVSLCILETTVCKPCEVQVQYLQDPYSNGCSSQVTWLLSTRPQTYYLFIPYFVKLTNNLYYFSIGVWIYLQCRLSSTIIPQDCQKSTFTEWAELHVQVSFLHTHSMTLL